MSTNQYMTMGFEGAMYVAPRGATSTSGMTLAGSVKNPKVTYSYDEVDASLRRHRGLKVVQKGMLDITINFTLPNIKPRSADAALIFASMMDRRQPISICMLDEEGGEGFIGDFELLGGDKSEENENAQEWEITAKPSAVGNGVRWIGS